MRKVLGGGKEGIPSLGKNMEMRRNKLLIGTGGRKKKWRKRKKNEKKGEGWGNQSEEYCRKLSQYLDIQLSRLPPLFSHLTDYSYPCPSLFRHHYQTPTILKQIWNVFSRVFTCNYISFYINNLDKNSIDTILGAM